MFFPNNLILEIGGRILVLGPIVLLWVTAVTRIIGLRTFSKMTAFDFVATVATGSLLASAAGADKWTIFIQSTGSILLILMVQAILAKLRIKNDIIQDMLSNDPILLMRDGKFCRAAMNSKRVTEADIWGKLREANVLDLGDVRAVVLETTGDISVLHGEKLDGRVLTGVNSSE